MIFNKIAFTKVILGEKVDSALNFSPYELSSVTTSGPLSEGLSTKTN